MNEGLATNINQQQGADDRNAPTEGAASPWAGELFNRRGIEHRKPSASAPVDADRKTDLTVRQLEFMHALITEPDIQAAAKAAGVGRTTAHRWIKQPAFRAELTRQRDEVLTETLGKAKTHAARAMARLVALLDVADERLRRQVCNDILGHALKVREMEDFERRITALEDAMKANGTNRRRE